MKCSLGISNFLEEISSLSHSIVFLYFFALTTEEGFLISPCYSLELCIQMNISFLFYFAFSFFSFLNYLYGLLRQHFAFLHFFFLGMVLITASCKMSWTSIHRTSSSLSHLIPWICLSLPLYNNERYSTRLNGLVVFPPFFNLSLNFALRSPRSEPQSAPVLFLLTL